MNLNRYLLIFFCSLLIIACKRSGSVSGKVTNVFDNTPMEGIQVRISESAELSPNSKNLQIGTSDINGSYKINATYNTGVTYDYYISLNPNDSYNKDNQYAVEDTTSDIWKAYFYYTSQYRSLAQDITDIEKSKSNQTFNFNVAPCARLRIIARNVAPANDSDKINVSVIDPNLIGGSAIIYSGKIKVPVTGNYMLVPTSGTVSLQWDVSTNGQQLVSYDTIPLTPYSKYTYYIEY